MDFFYFQNIMKPNDFARLNKLDKYNPDSLFSFINKYPKIIDLLLKYIKVNPKAINEYIGIHKYSLLKYAAMYDLSIVKNICELDANANNNNEDNWSALFYALHSNHSAKVLLEYDSITNNKTKYGKKCFLLWIKRNSKRIFNNG